MGAIFTAWKNRTPLVITAGQQARSLFPFDPFLFSAQATELPKPYVKWSCEPARAEDVPQAIAHGYYLAMQPPRGPVLVSIPSDDWARACAPVEPRRVSRAPRCDAAVLAAIGAALDASERPAFVVGAGVDRGGAWDEVRALAERHRARVFTAPMSARCGFAEDHPQFAGFLPAMRERIVAALAGSDLVLVLGAPAFTYHVEGHGPHLPAGAALCQITDDADTAARAPVGTAAVGDLRDAVQTLLQRAAPRERPAPAGRPARPRAEASVPMSVAYALQTLADVRDPDHVVVEEAPSSRPVMHGHLPMLKSETFYTMASGGLGFGLPAAVGVALARPAARVIALVGDGSAMYSIQALWSAVQLKLAMTFVILNNRRYAALQEFAPTFGFAAGAKLEGTDLGGLDFVAMARGMGVVDAVRVDRPEALARCPGRGASLRRRRRWSRSSSPERTRPERRHEERPPRPPSRCPRPLDPRARCRRRTAARLRAGLARQADPRRRRLPAGRRRRPDRPPRRPAAAGGAGPAGGDREPDRRRRQRRRRRGRQVGARRLHAADELGRHGLGESAHLREDELRPGQGPDAGGRGGARVGLPRGQARVPGEERPGVPRLREGESRQAQLRLARQRQLAAPRRRDDEQPGGHVDAAHSLPRRGAGAAGPARRADRFPDGPRHRACPRCRPAS